ncbi:MAG: endonuclease [Paracoccaceae bacterium]|nr:endonuclease [Paracoccaceae bacterium]
MSMLEGLKGEHCPRNCWIAGGVVGLVVLILAMVLFGASFLAGLFFGIVLGAGAAIYLNTKLCTAGEARLPAAPAQTQVAPAPPPPPVPAAVPEPAPAPAAKAKAPKPAATAPAAQKRATTAPAAQKPAATAPAAQKPAATAPAAEKAAAKAPAASGGTKPQSLSAPREGGADDLKQIKGVGPKLEKLLNGMGFYHFDQIAGWTEAEVAWVDDNLEGFKGRVSRDRWIEQAKTLAAGGETEFSARVGKGDVY